ncbi:hypothetical protein BB561_005792 [Smittium simulii]|uniref:Uncharacterized protein n=1 Tax=Smittium simulii TaxID=133385 RepID=A0A2T9Y8A5_9FUNG|nr:hypothetical protein BB561_005792 [Smittium simulii]
MDLPGRAPKLAEETSDSLFEPGQFDTVVQKANVPFFSAKRPRMTTPLHQRKIFNKPPHITQVVQQPILQTPKHLKSKILKQEERTRVLSRTIKYFPSRRTSLYVLRCIGQACRQSMGKKHSRKRLQNFFKSTYAPKFKLRQEIVEPRKTRSPKGKQCYRASKDWLFGILQQSVTISKKTGGLKPVLNPRKLNFYDQDKSFKMEFLTSVCRMIERKDYMASLDLEDAFLHILIHQSCRKYLSQSSPIWAIIEPTQIHQDFEALFDMGKKTRDQNIVILNRSTDCSRYQGEIFETYSSNQQQEVIDNPHTINPTLRNDHQFKINDLKGTNKQDLGLETKSCKTIENRQDNSKRISQFYWKRSSNVCCAFTRSFNATPTFRIKKQDINKNKIMGLHSKHNKSGHTELSLVEISIKTLEWSIIYSRDARAQSFYRCERLAWGITLGKSNYSGLWEKRIHIGTYQLQGTINNTVCLETTSSNRKINSDILEQYDIIAFVKKQGGTTSEKLLNIAEDIWEFCIKTNTRPQMSYIPTYMNPADAPPRLTA